MNASHIRLLAGSLLVTALVGCSDPPELVPDPGRTLTTAREEPAMKPNTDLDARPTDRRLPPIDARSPQHVETATFALG